jgi:tetratricopeptide (TPR) repeat protein
MSFHRGVRFLLALPLAAGLTVTAVPGHPPHRSAAPGRSHITLGGAGGGFGFSYGPMYSMMFGPQSLPVVVYPSPFWMPPQFLPVPFVDPGPLGGPVPPPGMARPPMAAARANAPRVDPGKADRLVTIGDRLFRAKNLKRAAERYEQAARFDPAAAAPRVRLAQVAVLRGRYVEAAERLREAVVAEPDWLAHAPDIQTVYGEPREFNRTIAQLESHLLLEPGDRDAWLVLGAQLYLSGQTRRASDVFIRLTDRKPDAALAAFLDATQPAPAEAK